jgi:hypothetical protein
MVEFDRVGDAEIFVVKTDSQGEQAWSTTYGGAGDDTVYCIQNTSDGGYVLCGTTDSFGDNFDAYVLKLDAIGDTIWTHRSGGILDDGARSIQQTSNGGYILTGWTSQPEGYKDIYVEKIDSLGRQVWSRAYHPGTDNMGNSLAIAHDNNYVIAGHAYIHPMSQECYLMKINTEGDEIWARAYGNSQNDFANSIRRTGDDGFIVAGFRLVSFFPDTMQFYVIKTNSQGDRQWERTYQYSIWDEGIDIIPTIDGNYALVGYSAPMGLYMMYDYCLLKIEGESHSSVDEHDVSQPMDFVLHANYPNPFNGHTIIAYDLPRESFVSLEIFNIAGRTVASLVNEFKPAGHYQVIWNAGQIPSGIYLYRLKTDKSDQTQKMVLLK